MNVLSLHLTDGHPRLCGIDPKRPSSSFSLLAKKRHRHCGENLAEIGLPFRSSEKKISTAVTAGCLRKADLAEWGGHALMRPTAGCGRGGRRTQDSTEDRIRHSRSHLKRRVKEERWAGDDREKLDHPVRGVSW